MSIKKSVTLQDAVVENEVLFLLSRVKGWSRRSLYREELREYTQDKKTRRVTYTQTLQSPNFDGKNRIEIQEHVVIKRYPGLIDSNNPEELAQSVFMDAVKITAWQRPQKSVLLEFEYAEKWQELVNGLISEIQPTPTPATLPEPTAKGGQLTKREPATPVYDANRERMEQTWIAIKALVGNGRPSYKRLIAHLGNNHPELVCTDDTLRKIIKLGKAGNFG